MDVRVPNLGENAESGVVVAVLVSVGDEIAAEDIIAELENEKAVAPVPAPATGTVTAVHIAEGDDVSVGDLLITLATDDDETPAPPEPADATQPSPMPAPTSATAQPPPMPASAQTSEFGPPASPSLRRAAREFGIELSRVAGSGRGGRITTEDVRNYVQALQQAAFAPRPAEAAPPPAQAPTPAVDFSQWGPIRREPMTTLRKTVARRLSESWHAAPHVTQFDEADITDLMALRSAHKAAYEEREARLTVTPFIMKVVATALGEYPIFNASLDESTNEIVFKDYIHIGIAVDTEVGLIVPVIRDVDRKSMLELSRELEDIAERTRSRRVSPAELQGGTFTISNQGGIGGGAFTPILNRPELAILGIGRGGYKALVVYGEIVPRMTMPLCLSYDHRLIDGGDAARFIVTLVKDLEAFDEALLAIGEDEADGTPAG